MHHFFGLMIDLSYYNEVIIYLYIFYTISLPIFVYYYVIFMRHFYNKPLFSIFYYFYLHKSCVHLLLSDFRFHHSSPSDSEDQFQVNPLPTICQIFWQIVCQTLCYGDISSVFFTYYHAYYYSISFRYGTLAKGLTNNLTSNLTNCW